LDLLFTKYLKAAVIYEDIQRIERFPVPRAALREAVLNALVHRDYAVPAPIQIRVYDDRLSLWNPAVLPDGWSLETLLCSHVSHPFNPEIANAFFRAGEIEAWGRGIERIHQACREDGSPAPELTYEANGLRLEFPFAQDYLSIIAGNQKTVAPEVAPEVTPEVTPEVDRLLEALTGEMSRSEIMSILGLKDEKHFREHYQQAAVKHGFLEMTIPDKPKSRLQKYHITGPGRARLQILKKKVTG
jgi:ATP-dependent DNA helicase RecG